MKQAVCAVVLSSCLVAIAFASGPAETRLNPLPPGKTEIMPLSQVRAGMRGVAYTVFEGTQPEPMGVEVLGVLKDMSGPRGDVILVRLEGKKAEYTGVVAGMSGSPVYVDGKLIGALAYRIGQFSKEPIGGVTPIEQMLEINALDRSVPPPAPVPVSGVAAQPTRTSSAGGVDGFRDLLTPIDTPLVFSGFLPEVVQRFAPQFAAAGVTPVMGAGSVTGEKQAAPIIPGSAVSMVLVKGDMNVAATCTVTYVDPQRLLACGHPVTQYGRVDIPMTKADVLVTLPSPMNSFKITNATEEVGAFVQDRHDGILGRFGVQPRMIPVTLTIHGDQTGDTRKFSYQVINNARLTGPIMAATVFNALQGVNDYGDDVTYKMQGQIRVQGYSPVDLENMYAPMDPRIPAGLQLALSVGERFSRIFDNPYTTPDVEGVNLNFDLMPERRWARLETARTDVTEARPGDDIVVEALLRPYRGEPILRQLPVKIPTSVGRGKLSILVSDGDTLDRMRRTMPLLGRKLDLASTIAVLNKEHANNRLYVSLLEPNPQAVVEDKVMPALPLSVINVMEGMRGTQEMVVSGESAVNESSLPLDYVVAGAQIIQVNIK
jgi:hypothetical protein